jgi:hypothetical protein
MKRFLALILITAALGAMPAWPAADASLPKRVEIEFAVYLGSMRIGEGRDRFEHDGRTYRIASESKTVGIAGALYRMAILREVQGRLTAAGLRPETYAETHNGKPKRSVRFDWDRKQATLFNGEKSRVVALPEGTWDTTSFGYNFAFFRPQSDELRVNLTDGRRISDYRYAVLGRQQLETEIGTLDTMHVKRVQEADDERAFEVWLAVDRHYAPVRIRYTDKKGKVFDSVVTKLTFAAS